MSEMNTGIKILIDRMQTNPEDFAIHALKLSGSHSWRGLAEAVVEDKVTFTDEEKRAVSVALREVTRKNFTAKILELLAGPEETTHHEYKFQEYQKNVVVAGTVVGTELGLQTIPPKQRLQK